MAKCWAKQWPYKSKENNAVKVLWEVRRGLRGVGILLEEKEDEEECVGGERMMREGSSKNQREKTCAKHGAAW